MLFCYKNIDLEKLKMGVFDYDDTLFIHSNHKSGDNTAYDMDILQFNNPLGEDGVDPWFTTQSSVHMKKFIKYLKKVNPEIRMGLCSAIHLIPIAEAKIRYTEEHYRVKMENYCTMAGDNTAQNKADMLGLICKTYGYEPHEILFVDDSWENRTACADLGINVLSPMEVVNFVEQYEHRVTE